MYKMFLAKNNIGDWPVLNITLRETKNLIAMALSNNCYLLMLMSLDFGFYLFMIVLKSCFALQYLHEHEQLEGHSYSGVQQHYDMSYKMIYWREQELFA